MGLFGKKKEEKKKEFFSDTSNDPDAVPKLPELPKLPEFSEIYEEKSRCKYTGFQVSLLTI